MPGPARQPVVVAAAAEDYQVGPMKDTQVCVQPKTNKTNKQQQQQKTPNNYKGVSSS